MMLDGKVAVIRASFVSGAIIPVDSGWSARLP
jgi:hypothetical protein